MPMLQHCPLAHAPHEPPQPSPPHALLVQFGVQPQTFAVPPPPHVCGAVQVPQLSVPPQPSEMVPQFLPCAVHVVGMHTVVVVVEEVVEVGGRVVVVEEVVVVVG